MKRGPLWIAGRVGILIVFGIMPIFRISTAFKWRTYDEQHVECMRCYDIAEKYLYSGNMVAFERWKSKGDAWCGKNHGEYQRLTGETNN